MKNNSHKNVSLNFYLYGFLLSILLTVASFGFIQTQSISHDTFFNSAFLVAFILILAMAQIIVQLIFFLHLGREKKPHWNFVFLIATIGVIFIIVAGSIWIINNLNYSMTPQQISNYLQDQQGF